MQFEVAVTRNLFIFIVFLFTSLSIRAENSSPQPRETWIKQEFSNAVEKLKKTHRESEQEQVILALAAELKKRSTPADDSDIAIGEANYFVNFKVAMGPLAEQAQLHQLDPFYCKDIRQETRRTDRLAQREKADGTIVYLPETLQVLKLIDVLCPNRVE